MDSRNIIIVVLVLVITFAPAATGENRAWWRTGVDPFVQQRHAKDGVAPSPEAPRRTLIRRLSLDLLGLPPQPAEVAGFVNDSSPDAYERLVERLLASPFFGERMAQFWLDLARYADSDGYHDDTNRAMWPYRDWVINAFNLNKPFDEFTIEQLAGDLLPNATLDQLVATAFLRNGPTTSEDGANPDEYRARYAVDRVNTMSQVWLGLTVQCAECHDHKYDSISIREYYQLFAFFNQSPEEPLYRGLYAPPSIEVPNELQAKQLREFAKNIDRKEKQLVQIGLELSSKFEAWKAELINADLPVPEPQDIICEFRFEGAGEQQLANSGVRRKRAKYRKSSAKDLPRTTDGLLGQALRFSADGAALDLGQLVEFRAALPFTFEAWVSPGEAGGAILSKIDTDNNHRGFDVRIANGRIVVRFVDSWPDEAVQVSTVSSFSANSWLHLSVTYDGSASADGVYLHVNGEAQDLSVEMNSTIRTIRNRVPLVLGGDSGDSSFDGLIDEVRFYKWPSTNQQLIAAPLLAMREITRSDAASQGVAQRFFRNYVYPRTAALRREVAKLRHHERLYSQQVPRLRVMRDQQQYRDTHVLVRGDFRSFGERVRPNTPAMLPPIDQKTSGEYTRLDLARWLVGANQDQSSRVTVNRLWALLYGRGIVPTLDDFGVQGEAASHPELLDWLQGEFINSSWDLKFLIRQIVLSAVYRQSSSTSADGWKRDPENELLTRGPRHRLPAETIRDNALSISGLASRRIGGPSVRPYQPVGLWREMSKGDDQDKAYVQSHGEDLYRRGIYTFWKRSIHYPAFAVFDAPSREVCTSSRPITNTPTQALAILNDPAFVEMARAFAVLILQQPGDFQARLQFAFGRAVARHATVKETEALRFVFESVNSSYKKQPSAAKKLVNVGESNVADDGNSVRLASWTVVAQIILTMDETISKE